VGAVLEATMARLGLAVAPLQEPWVAARIGVPTDAC